MLEVEINQARSTPIHNVEEDIESWAMQAMPLTREPVSDSQGTRLEPLPLDYSNRDSVDLCYGMVSRNLFLL